MDNDRVAERVARALHPPHWNKMLREVCDWEEEQVKAYWFSRRDTAVPMDYGGDELHYDIYNLFYYPLSIVRNEVAPSAIIMIEPNWECTTAFLVYLDDKVLFTGYRKAWYHWWESEQDFNIYCDEIAERMEKKLGKWRPLLEEINVLS